MNKKIKPRLLEKRKKGRRKERLHEERNRQINDSVKNKRLRQNRKSESNVFVLCNVCVCVCVCIQIFSLHLFCVYAFCTVSILNFVAFVHQICLSTALCGSNASQSQLFLCVGVACSSASPRPGSLQAVELEASVHSGGGEELSVLTKGHARHQPGVFGEVENFGPLLADVHPDV